MHRLSNLMLALVLFVLVMAGCSTPSSQRAISFMVWGSQAEYQAYQTLIDSFHAENPDYHVDIRFVPDDADYRRRLAADFSAGTPAGRDALELSPDRTLRRRRRAGACRTVPG